MFFWQAAGLEKTENENMIAADLRPGYHEMVFISCQITNISRTKGLVVRNRFF